MKTDLLLAIVRAHYRSDSAMMHGLVLQAASHTKNDKTRAELLGFSNQVRELPANARDMVEALPAAQEDDLVIGDSLREELSAIVSEHRHRLALELRGLRPRTRVLFHGPPGNGKTLGARMLAAKLNVQAYWVNLTNIVGEYMGASSARLAKLFPVLDLGVVLVLDELDGIGATRGDGADGATRERNYIITSILTLLDRHLGGVLVATTNRVDMLDPALLRRFDAVLEFPAPSAEEKMALRDKLLRKYGVQNALVSVADCASYDAVTKEVVRAARRIVLAEVAQLGPVPIGPPTDQPWT